MSFDFNDLVGGEFDFYGIDDHRFRLDDTTYEVTETSNGECEVVVSHHAINGLPIARVVVETCAFDDDCYELRDLHDDYVWLEFGSAYDGNDCLYLIFEYSAKGEVDPDALAEPYIPMD